MDEDVKRHVNSRASFSVDYTDPFSQNQVLEIATSSQALGFESKIISAGQIQLTKKGTSYHFGQTYIIGIKTGKV